MKYLCVYYNSKPYSARLFFRIWQPLSYPPSIDPEYLLLFWQVLASGHCPRPDDSALDFHKLFNYVPRWYYCSIFVAFFQLPRLQFCIHLPLFSVIATQIVLYFIILIIFCEHYKLWSSLLCNLSLSYLSLGLRYSIRVLYVGTSVWCLLSYLYKTTCKFIRLYIFICT
jgi:hypothetical protein